MPGEPTTERLANVFERAAAENWCVQIICSTCGSMQFRRAVLATVTGHHLSDDLHGRELVALETVHSDIVKQALSKVDIAGLKHISVWEEGLLLMLRLYDSQHVREHFRNSGLVPEDYEHFGDVRRYFPKTYSESRLATPGRAARDAAIKKLRENWATVVGRDFADVMQPVALTGKKGRRLIVKADGTVRPPWGGWTYLSGDWKQRRSFTRFRRAICDAIAPLEVDHIEFVTDEVDLPTS